LFSSPNEFLEVETFCAILRLSALQYEPSLSLSWKCVQLDKYLSAIRFHVEKQETLLAEQRGESSVQETGRFAAAHCFAG
jgi:hypothetical protein